MQSDLADTQAERAARRTAANRFIDELRALRKTFRVTLGTARRDYQRLRTAHARIADIDDTEAEPTEPTELTEVTEAKEVTEAAYPHPFDVTRRQGGRDQWPPCRSCSRPTTLPCWLAG